MAVDGSLNFDTRIDTTGFDKGTKAISNGLGSLKSSLTKLGTAVAAAFSVRTIFNFGKQAIETASDVQEVQNVVDTAFGDMAYKAEQFAETAIEQFGMSELSAKKTASTFMAMSAGMGMAADAASDMAIAAAGLTGDVASFFNISQEEAATKLKSIWTGETETLKDLGIVMTQANLNAYQKQKDKATSGEAEINSIIAAAKEEGRALQKSEIARINELQSQSYETGITALTENEIERETIMRRLKDNTVALSVEEASEVIKNALKTRDETISAAEKQYTEQVLQAQKMKDAGIINEQEYTNIVKAAEQAKNDTISKANQQYDGIKNATKTKLGENSRYIDEQTGNVKSKWQVFTGFISEKWNQLWSVVGKKWEEFKTGFSRDWHNFWADIGNFFIGIWNAIVGALEWAVNGMVGILNKFHIDLPGWLGGGTVGFHLQKVSFQRASYIPKLATGTVVPANYGEFLAVLGDNKRETEIVSPVSAIKQALKEAMSESGGSQSNSPVTIVLNISRQQLAKVCIDGINDLTRQTGELAIDLV